MIRLALAAGLLLGLAVHASAQTTLRVGDQKGNSQAVMEAAGVLKDIPYKIEWKVFPAAAPLLEALGAGAIETGGEGSGREAKVPPCHHRGGKKAKHLLELKR